MNNAITGARHELCKRYMESRIGREIVGRVKERMRGVERKIMKVRLEYKDRSEVKPLRTSSFNVL